MAFAPDPGLVTVGVLAYLIVIAVVVVLAYLVVRFGVRDGLRAHVRWLERRTPPIPPSADSGVPPVA